MRKIIILALLAIFSITSYGCFALFAGAAGGAGTAAWLSGKLTQEVNVPYERTINAARSGLKSLKLEVAKYTHTSEVTQIKSNYTDGREIWIDIRPITASATRIEVRVGAVGDKEAADKILKAISRYL
jgi:alkylated DNA nucleotide flippase Atl1